MLIKVLYMYTRYNIKQKYFLKNIYFVIKSITHVLKMLISHLYITIFQFNKTCILEFQYHDCLLCQVMSL